MIALRSLTLRARLVALVSSLLLAVCLFILVYVPQQQANQQMESMRDQVETIARMTASSLSAAVYFDDTLGIHEAFEMLRSAPEIRYANVHAATGQTLATFGSPIASRLPQYRTTVPVTHLGAKIGTLDLHYSLEAMDRSVASSRESIAVISLLIFLVAVGAVIVVGTYLTYPITRVAHIADEIAAGSLTLRVPVAGDDEVGHLAQSFNKMVASLEQSQAELREINQQLEQRVEERTRNLQAEVQERKAAEAKISKALEEASRAEKLKSAFISNMSHEIRTPLNIIMGYTSLIEEELGSQITPENRMYFESVHRGAERLMRTVSDILSLSRLEAGDMGSNLTEFDVGQLIERLVYDLSPIAQQKQLQLRYDKSLIGVSIRADSYCITQAISNLIDNAIKYTPSGSIEVRTMELADSSIQIEVADTGIGISEQYLPRVFEAYSQETTGLSRPFEGIGLGLALVKKYLDLHHATITVRSEKGVGTTFSIVLPSSIRVAHRSYLPATGGIVAPCAPTDPDRMLEILVVDDDRATLEYMTMILKKNFVVHAVRTPEEAIRVLHKQSIAVVLTDLSLGEGQTGLDLIRMIRVEERYASIPVIAVTAHVSEEFERQCLAAGCTLYLRKPILKRDLLEKLDHVLTPARSSVG